MVGEEQPIRVRITVRGSVQGVFFRASARDEARRRGVAGFARNQPDGSVLIEAEGLPTSVERFRQWCATGPSRADVESVDVDAIEVRGDRDFVSG